MQGPLVVKGAAAGRASCYALSMPPYFHQLGRQILLPGGSVFLLLLGKSADERRTPGKLTGEACRAIRLFAPLAE
jgi:hypothetical protein